MWRHLGTPTSQIFVCNCAYFREKTGLTGAEVTEAARRESDGVARQQREKIKSAMSFIWANYKKYAFGRDELKPLSRIGQDNWSGLGVTLVDALDTLWLMGMKSEFNEARDWVASSLSFASKGSVSVFETTIRELGGLLSAFDLSGERIFLEKAKDLGERLARAFDTPSGIACGQIGLSGGGCGGGTAVLSEMGTLQVEFRYLAHHTQQRQLEQKAMRGLQVLNKRTPSNGLYPIRVSTQDGSFSDGHITFGALGDSFYEYLLKTWVQGGRKETWLRQMYDRAMDGMIKNLLKASSPNSLAFVSDWNGRGNDLKMDHLVCFLPATLALGAVTDPNGADSPRARRDMEVAKALMYTCYQMYHRTISGLSPEYVNFNGGQDFSVPPGAKFYILRPETAESLFYLHQFTGEPTYRDWAWEIFEAIERNCRTEIAYGSLRDVNSPQSGVDDRMESFFLAETLKYLYLIQDPEHQIDLQKYVFNTEAHPTKVLDDSHIPISA